MELSFVLGNLSCGFQHEARTAPLCCLSCPALWSMGSWSFPFAMGAGERLLEAHLELKHDK